MCMWILFHGVGTDSRGSGQCFAGTVSFLFTVCSKESIPGHKLLFGFSQDKGSALLPQNIMKDVMIQNSSDRFQLKLVRPHYLSWNCYQQQNFSSQCFLTELCKISLFRWASTYFSLIRVSWDFVPFIFSIKLQIHLKPCWGRTKQINN